MNPVTEKFDPNTDAQLNQDLLQLAAARDRDRESSFLGQLQQSPAHKAIEEAAPAVGHWISNLPKNVGVGLIDAAMNTADAIKSGIQGLSDISQKSKQVHAQISGTAEAARPDFKTAQDAVDVHHHEMAVNALNDVYNEGRSAVLNFRNSLAANGDTSDEVTQALAQYTIPFLGYSKLIGGLHGANLLSTLGRTALTETLTAGTVLAPHDTRAADVLALGKHTEGKFADAMNTIAPDGSLFNAYIDYMSNRDGESDVEGRFKNVVDNLALTAAGAGLIRATALTLKGGRAVAGAAIENAGKGGPAIGPSRQRGMVAFHGSPYDFNAFDASKIGTGEGNQSFGHGLYFAENPATAGTYQARLSARRMDDNTALGTALRAMDAHNGNGPMAIQSLNKSISIQSDPALRSKLEEATRIIKAGNANSIPGKMYTVDIPDEKINNMLQWDKPLNEQPEIAKAIGKAARSDTTGGQAYQKLADALGSSKAASDYLAQQGIPGIKYLDQGSRAKGAGTHNIVLFDPNDAKIVKKQAGGKDLPIEKAQSASRTADAKAAEVNAPKTGVHMMQTGEKEWTLFVNGKASHVYKDPANAIEDLKALKEKN